MLGGVYSSKAKRQCEVKEKKELVYIKSFKLNSYYKLPSMDSYFQSRVQDGWDGEAAGQGKVDPSQLKGNPEQNVYSLLLHLHTDRIKRTFL